MADLLTVYDDEQFFVDCPVCDKKIIGETNLRIHQTTALHLKREEALAAEGRIPWPAPLPEWTDIIQYLKYLNLDEPIVGLSELVQKESYMTDDAKVMLRYRCKQCSVEMDMHTMATHLVGRKHRQKYVERKRQDLVTWNNNAQKAPAFVVRAKAAVVEKQEGWGTPVPLFRMKVNNQLNNQEERCGPARQIAFSGRNTSGQSEDFCGQSSSRDDVYRKSLPSLFDCRFNDPCKYKDIHQRPNRNEERYSTLNSDGERQRQLRQDDYLSEQPRFEGLNMAASQENHLDAPRSRHDDYQNEYTAMGPSRSLYSARDQQESFNQGGVLRSRFADSGSALRLEEMVHRENEGMQDQMFPSRQGRTAASLQPEDRMGRSDSFEMQDSRKSYLPNKDNLGKKKRKSRFSDASPQEIAWARLSQMEDMVSKNERNRPVSSRTHESGMKMGSDGQQFTPKMENVLDVLSDIQIENVEEANFLKDKLCTLLKEFQSNKVQRTQPRNANVTEFRNTAQPLMEQYKTLLQGRRSEDKDIPQFGKYDQDLRVKESRPFQDNFGYVPDKRRRNEKDMFQASTQYEGSFPKSGRFEEDPTGFPEKRGLGNDTRDYAGTRHFEKDLSAFQQRGQFQNETLDYHHVGRFDMDSENVKQNTSRDEGRHYSDYGTPSRSHSLSSRGAGDERYGVGKSDYQREPEWNSNREGSSGRFDRMPCYPEAERRGYEGKFSSLFFLKTTTSFSFSGFAENIWKLRSRESDGGYGDTQSRDYRSGAELYDPFQSQSPTRDMGHSSIDKLASTLLELVARKSH